MNALATQPMDDSFDDLLVSKPQYDPTYQNLAEGIKTSGNRFLAFEVSWNKDKGGFDKRPVNSRGLGVNDPSKGESFDTMLSFVQSSDNTLLGWYVEPPYLLIDGDHSIENETLTRWVLPIYELGTYTEGSCSGTGIHAIGIGTKPGNASKVGNVEIYSTKRAVALTGLSLTTPAYDVREIDITQIYKDMVNRKFFFGVSKRESVVNAKASSQFSDKYPIQHGGRGITDRLTLLTTGDYIPNAKPFVIADKGNNSVEYPSQSEAVGALLTCLAIKHKCDPEKMEDGYLESALSQIPKWLDKWERRREREITGAIELVTKGRQIDVAAPSAPSVAAKNSPAAQVTSNEDDEDITVVEDHLPEFPKFTGLLNDLCEAMSPDIPYPYLFGSAFAYFGLIRSGLDSLKDEPHVQPRPYVALVGGPERGKTASMNEIAKVMSVVSSDFKGLSTMDSGPALCDQFAKISKQQMLRQASAEGLEVPAARIVLASDELSGLFEKSKIGQNGRNTLLHSLLDLYESNRTGSHVRGAKIDQEIDSAHLAILGGATESGYASMWLGTMGNSTGMQSRVIPIGVDAAKIPAVQRPADVERLTLVTQDLIDLAKQPAFHFGFDPDALEMLTAWWATKNQKPSEVRMSGVAKKLLIVLARTNRVQFIGPDLVAQATSFADFIIACRERYNPQDAAGFTQANENLIREFFEKYGDMTASQCRQRIKPHRRNLGGLGPFLAAWKNMEGAGMLRECGRTHRSKIFKLFL